MFDSLLAWFGNARSWLDWLWRECWRQAGNLVTSVWTWGLIAVGWVYSALAWVTDSLGELAAWIDATAIPDISKGTVATDAVNFINTILPLQETLAFFAAYVALCLSLQMYKLIKSWIPTLAT